MDKESFSERVKNLNEMIKNPDHAQKFIESGILFQEAFGFSDKQMHDFYHFARRLCEEERFQDASDVFLVLTALNPYVCHFWLGLGLCHKIERNYKRALFDYSMGMAVDRENPYTYYNIADCYFCLGEKQIFEEFIDLCIEKSLKKEAYRNLEEEARAFKKKVNRDKKQIGN